MDHDLADFSPDLAKSASDRLWPALWGEFLQKPRLKYNVEATVRDIAFWDLLATLIPQVQPNPILLVSHTAAEGSSLRKSLYGLAEISTGINIVPPPPMRRKRQYIATVNGIDVYGAGIPAGVAWLFSTDMLQQISFEKLPGVGLYAAVKFVPKSEESGTLTLVAKPNLAWRDSPVLELNFLPLPEDTA